MRNRDIPKRWQAVIDAEPDSEQSRRYLAIQKRLRSVEFYEKKVELAPRKSYVGTRLVKKFKSYVGEVPCSACKQTMIRLDLMAVEDIREKHDSTVVEIEKNASKASVKFWVKIKLKADELFTGGVVTRLLISKLLNEACDDDDNETEMPVLDSDP